MTEVGYTQGTKVNPTYEEVCEGNTGHVEAVKVVYDTTAISYDDLLTVFWDIIDPTTRNAQGYDQGPQYRTGIYYFNDLQKISAMRSRDEVQKKYKNVSVKTEISLTTTWYRAEMFHQQYLERGGQCTVKGDLTPIRCYG
jgi:peptide-methionine (S)-S-oxide reductase